MPRVSAVSVFAVRPDGSTGDRIADGALVHPLAVLVDRHENPAAAQAAAANGLRVEIASLEPDRAGGVEVIDVVKLHAPQTDADPLAAVELSRPAQAAPEQLPQGDA